MIRKLTLCAVLVCAVSLGEQGAIYSPVGKRDPFKVPDISGQDSRTVATLSPQERFPLDQLELKAILRGARPQAMVRDPEGNVFIVSEGDVLGRERGTVSRILNREVIVTERTTNYLGRESLFERVLSLPTDKSVGTVEQGKRVAVPPPASIRTLPGEGSK